MKTIINTALIVGVLLSLLFIMKKETEALNGKILKLNDVGKNSVEVVERGVSSENQFIE